MKNQLKWRCAHYKIYQQGALSMNSIHAAATELLGSINRMQFFRRNTLLEIHGECHKILIWETHESLSLLRYF
ncbi:hypothetical protein HZS_4483 [Henneguya salminicola]|nr:hypothetical protein HZS_4483 [Henneguya salminicola]